MWQILAFPRTGASQQNIRGIGKVKQCWCYHFYFAKAFDKAHYEILLNILKKIGIKGTLGVWLKNFLSNI